MCSQYFVDFPVQFCTVSISLKNHSARNVNIHTVHAFTGCMEAFKEAWFATPYQTLGCFFFAFHTRAIEY